LVLHSGNEINFCLCFYTLIISLTLPNIKLTRLPEKR
jgi:hypothetical protein